MDNLEFAKAMIRYEELYNEMQELEDVIQAHVLEREESQSIGNVHAKYTNGRTVYDYETPGRIAPDDIVRQYTETIEKIDWRSICKEMQYEPLVKSEPVPSVKIVVKG